MAHSNKKHTNNTTIFHVILQLFLLSKALETKSIVVYQLLRACPSQSRSLIFSPSDSQNISPLWAQHCVSVPSELTDVEDLFFLLFPLDNLRLLVKGISRCKACTWDEGAENKKMDLLGIP